MADLLHEIALVRQRRNPARISERTIRIVRGEDAQLAITVWDRDTDTRPADTSGTSPYMILVPERTCWPRDYGFTHDGWGPATVIPGTVPQTDPSNVPNPTPDMDRGRIDFVLDAATTVALSGRYRFWIQANSQANATVLARGILDVAGGDWTVPALLIPPTPPGSGAVGEYALGVGGIGVAGSGDPNLGYVPALAGDGAQFIGPDGAPFYIPPPPQT